MRAHVGGPRAWLNPDPRYAPLAGVVVGAVGAFVLMATARALPMPVAVGLSIAATLWLSGARHEVGLANTVDRLGAPESAATKDSRLGRYGALALIVALGLKTAALVSLPLGWAAATLLVAHSLSRALAVALSVALPPADDAPSEPGASRVSAGACAIAWLWPLALAGALGWAQWRGESYALPGPAAWLAALGAAVVAGVVCARGFRRRFGRVSRDMLGAAQQFAELAVYLAVLAMLGR